jgi:hypothetical protein
MRRITWLSTWKWLETYENETALTNEPLSAGEAMSEMTPYAMGITPADISDEKKTWAAKVSWTLPDTPNAYSTLKSRSSLYNFASARQISAATNMLSVTRKAGRLPSKSAKSPASVGATVATAMYEVIAKLI